MPVPIYLMLREFIICVEFRLFIRAIHIVEVLRLTEFRLDLSKRDGTVGLFIEVVPTLYVHF